MTVWQIVRVARPEHPNNQSWTNQGITPVPVRQLGLPRSPWTGQIPIVGGRRAVPAAAAQRATPPWRTDRTFIPLIVIRVLVIAFSGTLAAIPQHDLAAVPVLLLVCLGATNAIPTAAPMSRLMLCITEAFGAALIVGAFPGVSDYFIPYLLIPVAYAGFMSTVVVGAGVGSGTVVFLVLAELLNQFSGTSACAGQDLQCAAGALFADTLDPGRLMWLPLIVGAGVVSAWVRKLIREQTPEFDPAYIDAHRLLTELQGLAGQLSSGLDPQTLAGTLADDLALAAGGARSSVCVRQASGIFTSLTKEPPSPALEPMLTQAWDSGGARRVRTPTGRSVTALPMVMGDAVVALAIVDSPGELPQVLLHRCARMVRGAAPRLASALVFDDVRRLATDDERQRLAREIHDGIAQDLASVGYIVDDIAADADDDVARRLGELREHVRGLVSELRLSIFDLRTGVDETKGLAGSMAEYVQRVGNQSGLKVHVTTEESDRRLPAAVETEVLRIVQEALTNVRKHAEASNIWLHAQVTPPVVQVTLTDDGRGLQQARPDSMGLRGMHERARKIGAHLVVANRQDSHGTIVSITMGIRPDTRMGLDVADSVPRVAGRHTAGTN